MIDLQLTRADTKCCNFSKNTFQINLHKSIKIKHSEQLTSNGHHTFFFRKQILINVKNHVDNRLSIFSQSY